MKRQLQHLIQTHIPVIYPTRRILTDFGHIVGGILLFISLIIFVSSGSLTILKVCAIVGFVLFVSASIVPKILRYPYYVWMGLGVILGLIIAPVTLALIFYIFFTPLALMKRIFSSNASWIKYDKTKTSYWQSKSQTYDKSQSKKLF